MIIRPATIEDIPEIVRMSRAFHEYAVGPAFGLGFSTEVAVRYLVNIIETPIGVLFVAEVDGRVVGSVCGLLISWYANPSQTMLVEQWWWVDPEYRQQGVARALLEKFEEVGRENKVYSVVLNVVISDVHNPVVESYERKGYKYLESHFIKNVEEK